MVVLPANFVVGLPFDRVLIHFTHISLTLPLMASTVSFSISSPSSFTLSRKLYGPFFPQKLYRSFVPQKLCFRKPISVKASSTSLDYSTPSVLEKQPAPLKVRLIWFHVLVLYFSLSFFFHFSSLRNYSGSSRWNF